MSDGRREHDAPDDAGLTVRARNAARRRAELAELERPHWSDRFFPAFVSGLVGVGLALGIGMIIYLVGMRSRGIRKREFIEGVLQPYWTEVFPLIVIGCALIGFFAGRRFADFWGLLFGSGTPSERAETEPRRAVLLLVLLALVIWLVRRAAPGT